MILILLKTMLISHNVLLWESVRIDMPAFFIYFLYVLILETAAWIHQQASLPLHWGIFSPWQKYRLYTTQTYSIINSLIVNFQLIRFSIQILICQPVLHCDTASSKGIFICSNVRVCKCVGERSGWGKIAAISVCAHALNTLSRERNICVCIPLHTIIHAHHQHHKELNLLIQHHI